MSKNLFLFSRTNHHTYPLFSGNLAENRDTPTPSPLTSSQALDRSRPQQMWLDHLWRPLPQMVFIQLTVPQLPALHGRVSLSLLAIWHSDAAMSARDTLYFCTLWSPATVGGPTWESVFLNLACVGWQIILYVIWCTKCGYSNLFCCPPLSSDLQLPLDFHPASFPLLFCNFSNHIEDTLNILILSSITHRMSNLKCMTATPKTASWTIIH